MVNPYQAPPAKQSKIERPPEVAKNHQRVIKFCIFALFATALVISFIVTMMSHLFRWLV